MPLSEKFVSINLPTTSDIKFKCRYFTFVGKRISFLGLPNDNVFVNNWKRKKKKNQKKIYKKIKKILPYLVASQTMLMPLLLLILSMLMLWAANLSSLVRCQICLSRSLHPTRPPLLSAPTLLVTAAQTDHSQPQQKTALVRAGRCLHATEVPKVWYLKTTPKVLQEVHPNSLLFQQHRQPFAQNYRLCQKLRIRRESL